jgi:hypothetical protein
MNNKPSGRKNIFLFLTLACFIGIILIFVFDGYMGLYDKLTMTSGEQTQTIEPEQWAENERYGYSAGLYAFNAETLSFSYEVDNRHIASYEADIEVSIWQNQAKIADILSGDIVIRAFGKDTVTWDIEAAALATDNTSIDNQFTLEIKHGEILRKVILTVPFQKNIVIKATPYIEN